MKIILASNSPRRKEILSQIGLEFDVVPSAFEEGDCDLQPEELVKYFAYMKAKDVYEKLFAQGEGCNSPIGCDQKDTYIIGSDTIVYCDKIMGKPKDNADAYKMLRCLSGREHFVMSGVSVIDARAGEHRTDFEKTKVLFKELSDTEIRSYINTKEPLDKAGAYAIQGIGSLFVEKIEGCYFNVVGFPVYRFSKLMEFFDVTLI